MPAPTLDETAKGVFAISATPFGDDGALDLDSTDRLVDFYLGCGVSGLTILGVMGEAPKLAPDESVTFTKRVLDRVGGRVPVVVGVSSPALDPMTALTPRGDGPGRRRGHGRAHGRPQYGREDRGLFPRRLRGAGATPRSCCRTTRRARASGSRPRC